MDSRGANRFNLRLSRLDIGSENEGSNPDENELLNILPSYHMYQSTIARNSVLSNEDLRTDPPTYEMTPLSAASSIDYFNVTTPTLNNLGSSANELPDEFSSDDSIVANSHKLKRLAAFNRDIARELDIRIYLTEGICKAGVEPKIINPLSKEYKQGDYVYGFVLITNRTTKLIPFDMFNVVFEGMVSLGHSKDPTVDNPLKVFKFLSMFDFNASWNDGYLDRFSNENNNPHVPKVHVDPYDHIITQLNPRKILEPQITYKKFFTFKIPERLLESSCVHDSVQHLQIPPTLGISKNEFIHSLRQKWNLRKDYRHEMPPKNEDSPNSNKKEVKYASVTNDMSFSDAAVSYCISARFIGKSSEYTNLVGNNSAAFNQIREEYVVANEDYCYIRVIPTTNPLFELNRSMIIEEARLMHTNLVDKVENLIKSGKEILDKNNGDVRCPGLHITESAVQLAKMQQSYYSKVRHQPNNDQIYEVFLPYKRKAILGPSKPIGLLALSSPVKEYFAPYIVPDKLKGPKVNNDSTKIRIPIDLYFIFADNNKGSPPDIKNISVEIVALTVKSKNLPIPLVFHHGMAFQNKNKPADNFDNHTIKTFQKYAHELSKIIKETDAESLDIDRDLLRDVKCLSNLTAKYDNFKVSNIKINKRDGTERHSLLSSVPWETEHMRTENSSGSREEQVKYSKKFDIVLDTTSTIFSHVHSNEFCLIPDFQFCYLARLYYFKINVKCPNGEKLSVCLPLNIQKVNI